MDVAPTSNRLQLLEPFKAWNGETAAGGEGDVCVWGGGRLVVVCTACTQTQSFLLPRVTCVCCTFIALCPLHKPVA